MLPFVGIGLRSMMTRSKLFTVTAGGALLVFGFLLGRSTAPSDDNEKTDSNRASPVTALANPKWEGGRVRSDSDQDSPTTQTAELGASLKGAKAVADRVFKIQNERERWIAFHGALQSMDANDLTVLLRKIQKEQRWGIDGNREWEMVWERWGAIDPEGALSHYRDADRSAWNSHQVATATYWTMRGWSENSPESAAAFAADPERSKGVPNALPTAVAGWAKTDLDGASSFVASLPDEKRPKQVWDMLAAAACREGGLGQLHRWFNSLPRDPELLTQAADAVVFRNLWNSPDAAADWIAANGGSWLPPSATNKVSEEFLKKKGPPVALGWIQELESGFPGRSDAASRLVQSLVKRDINMVGHWLGSQTDSAELDVIRASYAKSVDHIDSEAAIAWAETISDEELRKSVLQSVTPE